MTTAARKALREATNQGRLGWSRVRSVASGKARLARWNDAMRAAPASRVRRKMVRELTPAVSIMTAANMARVAQSQGSPSGRA